MASNSTHPAVDLPTYLLYADEHGGFGAVDVMHWESIAQRSSLHGWEIRPHRHEALAQLLLLERGSVALWLDGRTHRLDAPLLVTVMPLAAHGFRWSPAADGGVLTLAAPHLQRLLAADPALRDEVLQTRFGTLDAAGHAAVAQAMATVRDEYAQASRWRATAIDAALLRLLVTVARLLPGAPAQAPEPDRALLHVRRFRALVEARFREQPSVAALSAALGITPAQLTRVCRRVLGHPPLALLHARTVLEAQRLLAYTQLSVKQAAAELGFADAGYFTRFFERQTGLSPRRWRQQAQAEAARAPSASPAARATLTPPAAGTP